MTESSTETKVPAQPAAEPKTVPVAAIAEQRAKTRAALSEVEQLREELKAKEASSGLDLDAITQRLAEEARKTVEAELAPMRAEAAKFKLATNLGLSETQAEKVMDVRTKNPGLTESQALILARSEHADLFPGQASWGRPTPGAPVTGNSEVRTTAAEDFVAKMREAEKAGDRGAAQHWAEQEALNRFKRAFNNRPR